MRRRLAWLGAAAAALIVAAPAQAQWFNLGFGLRPEQVEREIEASGYELAAPVSRNGGVYLADVIGPSGHRQRLVVDATSGRLLQRFRGRRGYYDEPTRYSDSGQPIPRPPALVESRLVSEPLVIPGSGYSSRRPVDQQQARGDDSPFSMFNLTPTAPVAPDAPEKARRKPAVVKHRKIETAPVQPASLPASAPPAAEAPASAPTIVIAPTPTPSEGQSVRAKSAPAIETPTAAAPASAEPRVADTKSAAPATPATPAKPRKVINDLPVNTLE